MQGGPPLYISGLYAGGEDSVKSAIAFLDQFCGWRHHDGRIQIPVLKVYNPDGHALPDCKHLCMEQVPHHHPHLFVGSAPPPTIKGHLHVMISKIATRFEIEVHGPTWPAKALFDSLGMTGRQSERGYVRIANEIDSDDSFWTELAAVLNMVYHQFTFDPVITTNEKEAILAHFD